MINLSAASKFLRVIVPPSPFVKDDSVSETSWKSTASQRESGAEKASNAETAGKMPQRSADKIQRVPAAAVTRAHGNMLRYRRRGSVSTSPAIVASATFEFRPA